MKEDKKETAEERVEKKVRKRLTPYEWRLLKKRIENIEVKRGLKTHLSVFQREFRKQLATFITGAFAFVAALLWRDAIKSFIKTYEEYIVRLMPIKEGWLVEFATAFAVSILAIIAIIVLSKLLKPR